MQRGSRRRRLETLEARRLLAAEGAINNVSANVSTSGLIGDISGVWDWGDGRTTPANVNVNATNNPLNVRIDYSLDSNNFFADPRRRQMLQAAADSLIRQFADEFSAVSIDSPYVTWTPSIFHPSQGPSNSALGTLVDLPSNPSLAAGEIVIFAGARPLPGARVGIGGPGGTRFQTEPFTFSSPAERDAILAQIQADQDEVFGRGQSGALQSPPTDFSLTYGSVSFDTEETNFYFGDGEIEAEEIDFFGVAVHELAHAFGFGLELIGATSAWERLVSGGRFRGNAATAEYLGAGNPPVGDGHWDDAAIEAAGQETVMTSFIPRGERLTFSTLDFAAMDDIGWELNPAAASVTGSHRYADDGVYQPTLTLSGSIAGSRSVDAAAITVTNAAPTITPSDTVSVILGVPTEIALGSFEDAGFDNPSAQPPTSEAFTATVNWGDGVVEPATIQIDRDGNFSGLTTRGTVLGTHAYTTPGTKTVSVVLRDDDGGGVSTNFAVNVTSPPSLNVSIDRDEIAENAGGSATNLQVVRGGDLSGPLTVTLSSSDESELTLTATATFAAGVDAITVPVDAVDDSVVDGDQTVTLDVSASGFATQTVSVTVTDFEQLQLRAVPAALIEGESRGVAVLRSEDATSGPLPFSIVVTGNAEALVNGQPSGSGTIAAGDTGTAVVIASIDDAAAEAIEAITIEVSADGYEPSSLVLLVSDDERPPFQNPDNRLDADENGQINVVDALVIINELRRRDDAFLNPSVEDVAASPKFDVNGDNRISPTDALQIINALRRGLVEPEQSAKIASPSSQASQIDAIDQAFMQDDLLERRFRDTDDAAAELF